MLALLLSCAVLGQNAQPVGEVERAARDYRIAVYQAFHGQRRQYDYLRELGDELREAWRRAGQPTEYQPYVVHWFRYAAYNRDLARDPSLKLKLVDVARQEKQRLETLKSELETRRTLAKMEALRRAAAPDTKPTTRSSSVTDAEKVTLGTIARTYPELEPSDRSADLFSWFSGYPSVTNESTDTAYVFFSDDNTGLNVLAPLEPGESTPAGADWADHVLVGAERGEDGALVGGTWYKLGAQKVLVTKDDDVVSVSTGIEFDAVNGFEPTLIYLALPPTDENPMRWHLVLFEDWLLAVRGQKT